MPQIATQRPFILPPEREDPLGRAVGTGLGRGLEALAQQRLKGLAQGRQASGLQAAFPELSEQQTQALGGLDPKSLDTVLKQITERQRSKGFQEALSGMMGGAPQQGGQGIAPIEGERVEPQSLLSPEDARRLAEFGQRERQFTEKQRSDAFRQTADSRNEVLNLERATLEDLDRVEIMSKLGGNLDHPAKVKFLEKAGLEWMLNPNTQTFKKLRNDFVVNARALFGAKPAAALIERYLESIPSLMQSKEGRDQIIKTFKHMRQGSLVRAQIMRNIIKENNGTPPLDIMEKIQERAGPQLEKLSEKFISSMEVDGSQLTGEDIGRRQTSDPTQQPVGSIIKMGGSTYRVVQKGDKKTLKKVR